MVPVYNEIMRGWVGVLLVGCSSVTSFPPSDDIATPFDGGHFDATVPKDASTFDVVDEDATKFNGGGSFMCIDCICDGTLNVCEHISGGNIMSGDAGDASTCDPDAGQPYCAPIAIDCLPKPSCACVLTHYPGGCTCDVDPSGNGLVVSCDFP